MQHELKTWPEFFEAVRERKKTFELRHNDRNYKVSDHLRLREFDPCRACKGKGQAFVHPADIARGAKQRDCPDCHGSGGLYTGREAYYAVTYILNDHPGIRGGYVIMGLKPTETA